MGRVLEKEKEKVEGWAVGLDGGNGLDRFCFFFSFPFFSNPFQTNFKPFSFKSFTSFQIQIFTQISPTILKAFHKPFLTTFQTFFKFKLLHKFSQTFSQLFLRTFSQIFFKTFKTTTTKLMHFNMMHKHLVDSNY
jgi:hypothetical protein